METPYRKDLSKNLKSEIQDIKNDFLKRKEEKFQLRLSEIKDSIKRAASEGKNECSIYVEHDEVKYWFFWSRVKEGTDAHRIFNFLNELGFEPKIYKWGADDYSSRGACLNIKL